ncbi:MAG: helix-turn-helix domain-containing protein [Sciscionella sp.]
MADAGRHLGIPQQTFHRWARGYERGGPCFT